MRVAISFYPFNITKDFYISPLRENIMAKCGGYFDIIFKIRKDDYPHAVDGYVAEPELIKFLLDNHFNKKFARKVFVGMGVTVSYTKTPPKIDGDMQIFTLRVTLESDDQARYDEFKRKLEEWMGSYIYTFSFTKAYS